LSLLQTSTANVQGKSVNTQISDNVKVVNKSYLEKKVDANNSSTDCQVDFDALAKKFNLNKEPDHAFHIVVNYA
jgi:hypothetical protein